MLMPKSVAAVVNESAAAGGGVMVSLSMIVDSTIAAQGLSFFYFIVDKERNNVQRQRRVPYTWLRAQGFPTRQRSN